MKSIRHGGSVAGRSCSMRPERGQALVEFAIMIPFFLLLLLGGADVLMAFSAKSSLNTVAAQTAQCLQQNNSICSSGPQAYAQSIAPGLGMNASQLTASRNACVGVPNCFNVTVNYVAAPIFKGFFPNVSMQSTAQYTVPPGP